MSHLILSAGLFLLAGDAAEGRGEPPPLDAVLRLGTERLRHDGPVLTLAFAPDGKSVFSGGYDGTVRRWDLATGKEVGPRLENGCVMALAVRQIPGGRLLVAGSYQSRIRVWDAATGKVVGEMDTSKGSLYSLELSPDGNTLLAGGLSDGAILYDVATAKELRRFRHAGGAPRAALSPDGKTVAAAGSDGAVRLWDAATGRDAGRWAAHEGACWFVAFTAGGTSLVTAGADRALCLWDVVSGKRLRRVVGPLGASCYAASPDGKTVAAGDATGIDLWDLATGAEARRLDTGRASVRAVAFSPDGQRLAAAVGPLVRVWDVATGKELHPPEGHTDAVTAVAFSHDGAALASGGWDRAICLYDLKTGRLTRRIPPDDRLGHDRPVFWLGFAAGGDRLVSAKVRGAARLWDVASGKMINGMGLGHKNAPRPSLTGDGGALLRAERDELAWYDLKDRARWWLKWRLHANEPVLAVACSPDGRAAATLLETGVVELRDGASGEVRRRIQTDAWGPEAARRRLPESAVAFSPDGRWLAVGGGGCGGFEVWEVATGRRGMSLEPVPDGSLVFSPDGRLIAVAEGRGRVALCEVASGRVAGRFAAGNSHVPGVAFSPDGRSLAVGGADGAVTLWRVPGPKPAARRLTAKELEGFWADLQAGQPSRALPAIAALAAAPARAVPFLAERLRLPEADPKRVAALIDALGAKRFAERVAAERELEALGEPALPALRKALPEAASEEARRRIGKLLERLDGPAAPQRLAAGRAFTALEQIGTAEARRAFEDIVRRESPSWRTEEARAAVQRLRRRGVP